MNICKITNWIGNFIDYTMDSDYVEKEYDSYDLNEVIFTISIGTLSILFHFMVANSTPGNHKYTTFRPHQIQVQQKTIDTLTTEVVTPIAASLPLIQTHG